MSYYASFLAFAVLAMPMFSFFSDTNVLRSELWVVGGILIVYGVYAEIQRRRNPFKLLNGPEVKNWVGGHMGLVLE